METFISLPWVKTEALQPSDVREAGLAAVTRQVLSQALFISIEFTWQIKNTQLGVVYCIFDQ